VIELAQKYNKTPAQLFFRYMQSIDVLPLSGTTSEQHMSEDVAAAQIEIEQDDLNIIQATLYQK